MSEAIINVTATKGGETLEDNADIGTAAFSSLLDYADEIVVHDVLDVEQYEKKKSYYEPHGFDEVVTVEDGALDESGQDDDEDETADETTNDGDEPETPFKVGDVVRNPSQRPDWDWVVVDNRWEKTFGGRVAGFVVRRKDKHEKGFTDDDEHIQQSNWENWEVVEE